MIISLYSSKKDDKHDIDTNASYLSKKLTGHVLAGESDVDGEDIVDYHPEIYIVAHGSPKLVADFSPEELADKIATYINMAYSQGHKITSVELRACNSGLDFKGKTSFAKQFRDSLEDKLTVPQAVIITAPTGMTVYFESGEMAVLKDDNPYSHDVAFDTFLSKIDISDEEAANKAISSYLIDPPLQTLECMPVAHILDSDLPIEVYDDKDDLLLQFGLFGNNGVFQQDGRFLISKDQYTLLTEKFAEREMAYEPNSKYLNYVKS